MRSCRDPGPHPSRSSSVPSILAIAIWARLPIIESVGKLRSTPGASRARYAIVVAALALFGLLSMHGWGTHAGMHTETSHSPAQIAPSQDDGHPDVLAAPHHNSLVSGAAPTYSETVSCDDGCGASGSGTGLLGLCLAILGGLLVLAVALLVLRRCMPLLRTIRPTFRNPVPMSRDRDPPDIFRFCVIRC